MPEPDESDEGGRAFWSGMLSFGLVSIPVELLPAHRSSRPTLHLVDADGTRLARRYYCSAEQQPVDADHIVRGYELENGKLVVLADEELEALAPSKSREIDLRLFVDRHAIDPLYFERSYFLAPGKGAGKAYRLLGQVMESAQRAGIASFVMRDKEYLVAIFSEGGLLRAETLRYHDEVRSTSDVGLPQRSRLDASAVQRMTRAVAALAEERWDPSELHDPHASLRELAEHKHAQGKDVIVNRRTPEGDSGERAIDLFEVLRQSLAQNDLAAKNARPRARAAPAAAKKTARKRTATRRKAAPRKSPTRRGKAARSRAASA